MPVIPAHCNRDFVLNYCQFESTALSLAYDSSVSWSKHPILPCTSLFIHSSGSSPSNLVFALTVPSGDQWGDNSDSPGAKLSYKEIGISSTIQGRMVITLQPVCIWFIEGRSIYVLCVLNVGSDPKAVADVYLNR